MHPDGSCLFRGLCLLVFLLFVLEEALEVVAEGLLFEEEGSFQMYRVEHICGNLEVLGDIFANH